MLQELRISNYAIIDRLKVRFVPGFITVTGETGAGKSIILGALGLVLGERADLGVLRSDREKAVVEAEFNIENYALQALFEQFDLDHEPLTIIRREISPSGKSRAFVNDTPVNLNILKEIGETLVDIHSQNETLTLRDRHFQLDVVDRFAGVTDDVKGYTELFEKLKILRSEYRELADRESRSRADTDFLEFQFNELESALMPAEEFEEMENEVKTLENAEEIKTALYTASNAISNGEENAVSVLRSALSQLTSVKQFGKSLDELCERLNSTLIEVEDIGMELNRECDAVEVDPGRAEAVRERLDEVYRLQHKHRAQTFKELIDVKEEIALKINSINSLSDSLTSLEKEVREIEEELNKRARKLSSERKKVFSALEKEVMRITSFLGLDKAQFEIRADRRESLGDRGIDEITFLFAANTGSPMQPLGKVASGGELSRVMLALKYILSSHKKLPTIIFDEIDTGVSGRVAGKLASVLTEMSKNMQVLAITHLPQVAAKGDAHFKVAKSEQNGAVFTSLIELDRDRRIEELAGMLSGEKTGEAAVKNATELLESS